MNLSDPAMHRMNSFTNSILCFALLIAFAYAGQTLLVPIAFAVILSVVLLPIEETFTDKLTFPRVIAILSTIPSFVCVIGAFIIFIDFQLTEFFTDLPLLKRRLGFHLIEAEHWISRQFGIAMGVQQDYIDSATQQVASNPQMVTEQAMNSLQTIFSATILVPVLLFLLMYYRKQFLTLLTRVSHISRRTTMNRIIAESKTALQGYVTGLFIEVVVVASLQTTAAWISGVQYFVFIGLLTGVLNMIPYLGILIAAAISSLIAIASGATVQEVLFLLGGFVAVQLIDNNILLPRLVGHRVRLNAFVTICGVIAGGMIWGISGMFLAIPFLALIKVFCEHVPHLNKWSEAMGEQKNQKLSQK